MSKKSENYGISVIGLILCGIAGLIIEYVFFRALGVVTCLVSPLKMVGCWFVFSLIVAAMVLVVKKIMRRKK